MLDNSRSGWLPGRTVKLLGIVRLRQQRIKYDECSCEEPVLSSESACCSKFSPDNMNYDRSWNQTYRKSSFETPHFWRITDPWQYRTAAQLKTLPVFGRHGLYNGGGYVLHLGRTQSNSIAMLKYMQRYRWLDQRTRVVFVELAFYGVNANIFNVISLVFERTDYGNYILTTNIASVKLLLVLENLPHFTVFVFAVYLLLTTAYVLRVLVTMIQSSPWHQFFKVFWNCLDVVIVTLSIGSVYLFFERNSYVIKLIERLRDTRNNEFVSFFYATFYDQCLNWLAGILICIATVRTVRIFQFIFVFRVTSRTLVRASGRLAWTTVVMAVFLVALASCVHMLHGDDVGEMSSVAAAMISLVLMSCGIVQDEFGSATESLGIFVHILVLLAVNIYLLNLLVTIVCSYFAVVQQEVVIATKTVEQINVWKFFGAEFREAFCQRKMESSKTTEDQKEVAMTFSAVEKNQRRLQVIKAQLGVVELVMKIRGRGNNGNINNKADLAAGLFDQEILSRNDYCGLHY